MKKLYWKPGKISWKIHVVIALFAVIGFISVETFKIKIKTSNYKLKIKAAKIMKDGMDILKEYRYKHVGNLEDGTEIPKSLKPYLGSMLSPITSNTGYLPAKIASVNPNWASVIVSMLKKAKVKKGDCIALAFSGSFPMMNLAVLSAAEAMKLDVVLITSLAGSTWGANIPNFTWLDMEKVLNRDRILSKKTIAASLGGSKDRGLGMSKEGRKVLRDTIDRHKIRLIYIKDSEENISERMRIYNDSSEKSISAFINVGGGTISVGTKVGKKLFRPGVNLKPPYKALKIDSVMTRFAKKGVPIIHISNIAKIAEKYKIPYQITKVEKVGQGEFFNQYQYNYKLVIAILIALIILLYIFIKMDLGYRIFSTNKTSQNKPPEQMV